MALPIETTDHLGKAHRYVLCSVYHPTGASSKEQAMFEEMLVNFYREVEKKGNIMNSNLIILHESIRTSVETESIDMLCITYQNASQFIIVCALPVKVHLG